MEQKLFTVYHSGKQAAKLNGWNENVFILSSQVEEETEDRGQRSMFPTTGSNAVQRKGKLRGRAAITTH